MKYLLYLLTAIVLLSCSQSNRKSLPSNKETGDTAVVTHQFIPNSDQHQTTNKPPPPPSEEDKCIFLNSYTPQERKYFFPFNRAVKIQLVSFTSNGCVIEAPKQDANAKPKPEVKHFCGLPNENGKVEVSLLKEQITLTTSQIEQLSTIIYNYDSKSEEEEVSGCYEPRNAVIFLGKNDELIAYLDICFECNGFEAKPVTLLLGEFCNDKYEALKKLFKEAGIQYGTEER